jgi:hypothetical protein
MWKNTSKIMMMMYCFCYNILWDMKCHPGTHSRQTIPPKKISFDFFWNSVTIFENDNEFLTVCLYSKYLVFLNKKKTQLPQWIMKKIDILQSSENIQKKITWSWFISIHEFFGLDFFKFSCPLWCMYQLHIF